jgi:hypothetical protein
VIRRSLSLKWITEQGGDVNTMSNEMPEIATVSYTTDSTSGEITYIDTFGNIVEECYKYKQPHVNYGALFEKNNDIEEEEKMSERRLVKVMIVDPDLNVPVEKAVLVSEPEKITDLDDQELFFELDIKNILNTHNDFRKSVINKKKSKDKDVYLEPIRIRDLKMVILTIANF